MRSVPCVIGLGTNPQANVDPRQGLEALSKLTGAVNRSTTTIANGTADPIAPGDPFYFQIASGFASSVANGVVSAIQNAVTNVAVNIDSSGVRSAGEDHQPHRRAQQCRVGANRDLRHRIRRRRCAASLRSAVRPRGHECRAGVDSRGDRHSDSGRRLRIRGLGGGRDRRPFRLRRSCGTCRDAELGAELHGGPQPDGPRGRRAQTIIGWATNISPGPAGDAGQQVNFLVSNDANGLFSVQPAIAPDGTLTYTPALNAYGVATVSVQLHDNGGTANGGVDTSDSRRSRSPSRRQRRAGRQ